MILLKNKINKKELVEKMTQIACDRYFQCWEQELCINSFMDGVKYVLNELQIKKDNENDRQ